MSDEVKLDERRRRALYRARHRGTKEMDWLLGRFATEGLAAMDDRELAVFERVLALPDPALERWIVLAPEEGPDGEIEELLSRVRRFHGLDA